ncbi:MAG: CARDB domain-containing protein, partial [Candidatus Poseidonia sp.]|nr:CARDB domain-containing protein [Poseidonia sp.]
TLTVNANITMETGSSITVEEGGQLVITNGGLYSDDLNAGLMVNSMFATLTLNFGDLADEGVLQLKLDHVVDSSSKMNVSYDNTTFNASGADLIQFNVPLNGTDIVITFDSYYFTPTYVLWAKAIHSGGDTSTLMPQEINASDAPLYWFQSGYDVIGHGDVTVTNGEIEGASIHCASLCKFDRSTLTGSAPINAENTSTVMVQNSSILGSRTDEDIVLHDQATITYENSQGTGGTTDAWIRLLPQRTLSTNIPNGSLDIYDMGWGANDWNDLTDENGDIVLVEAGGTTEHKRIVAWMDGNGVVHQEDATITLSITSSWGTFSQTISAPTTAHGTIELDLPFVQVTAVEPETSTAVANKSVSGMVTVTNTGTAAASSVNIWCYADGEVADTTQIVASLGVGETKQVPFTWYAYQAGDEALNCKPLLPAALDNIANVVVNADGADSQTVTWEYVEEVEEAPLVIYIVVALGFMVLALVVASQAKAQREKEYATYSDADDAEKEDAEMLDELEEAKTPSIVQNITYNIHDSAISGDIN